VAGSCTRTHRHSVLGGLDGALRVTHPLRDLPGLEALRDQAQHLLLRSDMPNTSRPLGSNTCRCNRDTWVSSRPSRSGGSAASRWTPCGPAPPVLPARPRPDVSPRTPSSTAGKQVVVVDLAQHHTIRLRPWALTVRSRSLPFDVEPVGDHDHDRVLVLGTPLRTSRISGLPRSAAAVPALRQRSVVRNVTLIGRSWSDITMVPPRR